MSKEWDILRHLNRKPSERNIRIIKSLLLEMKADKDYSPYGFGQIEQFMHDRDAKKLLD